MRCWYVCTAAACPCRGKAQGIPYSYEYSNVALRSDMHSIVLCVIRCVDIECCSVCIYGRRLSEYACPRRGRVEGMLCGVFG